MILTYDANEVCELFVYPCDTCDEEMDGPTPTGSCAKCEAEWAAAHPVTQELEEK